MSRRPRTRLENAAMIAVCLIFFLITLSLIPKAPKDVKTNFCPQEQGRDPFEVAPHLRNSTEFLEDGYKRHSLELLQKAIQYPTEVEDGMDVNHPEFLVFTEFHAFLRDAFPLAAEHVEIVNKYGLVYTIDGKSSHRPTLLVSHQDVIPAGNSSEWQYPPFSGHFDGHYVHGRGSSDSKNTLMAILEAVEALLAQDWQPESPLVIAFGFDKEIGGRNGAENIASFLKERYGEQSFKVALDEGTGVEDLFGSPVALTAVNEKGNIDVNLEVKTPGGHSSNPPDHTGIGLMARIIRLLERNSHSTIVPDDNPILQLYRCVAEHSLHMSKDDRRIVLDPDSTRRQQIKLIKQNHQLHDFVRTTQAVTWIKGGVKINALPESVNAVITHHVSVDSSAAAVIDRVEHFVLQVAEEFDLEVWSENTRLRSGSSGAVYISSSNVHSPSPVSPYTGRIWDLVAGTTRHVFGSVTPVKGEVIVAPSVRASSTDSHFYWDLTRYIYRFSPGYARDNVNRHTVNERVALRSHLIAVAWYYEFIINTTS